MPSAVALEREGLAKGLAVVCVVLFCFGYCCGRVDGLEKGRDLPPIEVKCLAN